MRCSLCYLQCPWRFQLHPFNRFGQFIAPWALKKEKKVVSTKHAPLLPSFSLIWLTNELLVAVIDVEDDGDDGMLCELLILLFVVLDEVEWLLLPSSWLSCCMMPNLRAKVSRICSKDCSKRHNSFWARGTSVTSSSSAKRSRPAKSSSHAANLASKAGSRILGWYLKRTCASIRKGKRGQ